MGKESARAGDVFFRSQRVDLILHFVVLTGNGDDTGAMHGTGGRTQRGEGEAQVIPGEIQGIGESDDSQGKEEGAAEQIHSW